MTADELVARYPRLYHMAEAETWGGIKRHGLLSTSALLDLFEVTGERRLQIESQHRPKSVDLPHPRWGKATVRDQKPMSDKSLRRALKGTGMTPRQWYELLNGRVFFWLTVPRLCRLLKAGSYCDQKHTVLTIDTAGLVKAHEQKILLSPMNSGATKPYPHPRGPTTFLPITKYPYATRKSRSDDDAVVELTIEHSVPNIEKFTIRVEHMQGDDVLELIYAR